MRLPSLLQTAAAVAGFLGLAAGAPAAGPLPLQERLEKAVRAFPGILAFRPGASKKDLPVIPSRLPVILNPSPFLVIPSPSPRPVILSEAKDLLWSLRRTCSRLGTGSAKDLLSSLAAFAGADPSSRRSSG